MEVILRRKPLPLLKVGLTSFRKLLIPSTFTDGKVDGVFFGRLWIAHPDLAKRFEHGKALDNQLDFMTLYGIYQGTEEEQKKGYIDYPPAQY